MKVCMIAQHSISMVGGGPKVQALQTARYLPDHGVDVEFFNPWSEYDWKEFDLAHLFGANYMTYDIALRLHQFSIPFVTSSIFFTQRGPAFMRAARLVERVAKRAFSGIWTDYGVSGRVCELSSRVLPNTTDEAMLIEKGFGIPKEKIEVIPNGVEERFYQADPRLFIERYGVRDFILNVGHIGSKRKNVLSLIRALKGIDHPAVIIGKIQRNEYSDRCIEEASRNRNITIIDGLASDSKMLESAYAACSVFALPSYFETPGIAALEAALAGASIAITPYGGTKDYFMNDAVYVEPDSVASIARGIEEALNRPGSSSLRERIYREYLWQRVAEKTARAYHTALKL
jgi:glycosyltransferase involved in cell wall biosynthesis